MNKTVIFYFSGTGNSLAVAKDLKVSLGAQLLPVMSFKDNESIEVEADNIVFVFPLYDFKPPKPVDEFTARIKNLKNKYIFAVCTYGVGIAGSMKHFKKVLEANNGKLAGAFGVEMPHNGIGSALQSKALHQKMFKDWENRTGEISEYIRNKKEGTIESGSMIAPFLKFRYIKMLPSLMRFLGVLIFKGVDSLGYKADDKCNGCGICKIVCPVNNIDIEDKIPVWGDKCVNCFTCLHWCPKNAVSLGGHNLGIGIYHHPEVELKEMTAVKGNNG